MSAPITRRRFWLWAAPLVLTLLALFALTAIPASAQTDRYVDPAGACAGNSNCYTTIGAAVAASGPGDTICVHRQHHRVPLHCQQQLRRLRRRL